MQKLSQEAFLRDVRSSEKLVRLITVSELAELLNVRKEKATMLAYWAIGCYKVGNRLFVSEQELDIFLKSVGKSSFTISS